ncbi:MAG: sulfatase-like hydrolase/transferase [Armatimonadota bacterium]|nr:sulfatase-like hydrolase/transferase [Armatimonadota bacterium]
MKIRTKPNVLFLITDQHNRRIAGFAGNKAACTPNLDQLAAQSICFENAYCQVPLCTPSRISMWTGKVPHRCSAWTNYSPIFQEHLTMPEHFAKHGYITCGIGKMHVGGIKPMNGFQFRPYGDLIPNRFCCHQPDPLWTSKDQQWTKHSIGHFPFAGESEIPESLLQENIVTREALAFIFDHSEKHPNQPWFVCASYSRPHHPLTAPARFFRKYWPDGPELHPLPKDFPEGIHPHDKFIVDDYRLTDFSEQERRKALSAYHASVEFVDSCIGELLDNLQKKKLLDNTIVVYLSDHGDLMSEHGLWWKRSYYDGSAAVPLLIRIPPSLKKLRQSDEAESQLVTNIVELLDLFPTLCDLCDIPKPDNLDGESLLPENKQKRLKNSARSELIARMETTFRMIRTPEWKYVEFPKFPPILFNMIEDPNENHNLASEPKYVKITKELHALMWEDCQSWESLFAKRQADFHRAASEGCKIHDCCPNQYSLPNGEIIQAEEMLYKQYLP